MWRSRWIDGSATFTIVLSSMIMKRPMATAPSVHHLRFSDLAPCSTELSFPSQWQVSRG